MRAPAIDRIDLLAARHREAVIKAERTSLRRMARLYADVETELLLDLRKAEGVIRSLGAEGREAPSYLLRRYADLGRMLDRAERRLQEYSDALAEDVLAQKAARAGLGAEHASALMRLDVTDATVRSSLRSLNEAAIREIAGSTSPGSPLRTLIASIPGNGVQAIERVLVTGIAQGQHPTVVARRMRAEATALDLRRSVTIARNESLRAYTAAQSATYAENSDVVDGMRIVEACDARTCPLCWARHGKILPVGATLARHVCCRGSLAPQSRYSLPRKTGPERFAELPSDRRREILGPGRHALYEEGMPLEAIYGESIDPLWGPQVRPVTIADLSKTYSRPAFGG